MSHTMRMVSSEEITTVRIICQRPIDANPGKNRPAGGPCGMVFEIPIDMLDELGAVSCPSCKNMIRLESDQDSFAKLAQALRTFKGQRKLFHVEFPVPEKS